MVMNGPSITRILRIASGFCWMECFLRRESGCGMLITFVCWEGGAITIKRRRRWKEEDSTRLYANQVPIRRQRRRGKWKKGKLPSHFPRKRHGKEGSPKYRLCIFIQHTPIDLPRILRRSFLRVYIHSKPRAHTSLRSQKLWTEHYFYFHSRLPFRLRFPNEISDMTDTQRNSEEQTSNALESFLSIPFFYKLDPKS